MNYKSYKISLALFLVIISSSTFSKNNPTINEHADAIRKSYVKYTANLDSVDEYDTKDLYLNNATSIVGSSKINKIDKHHVKTYFLYGAEHLKLENYYFDIPIKYNAAVKKWIHYFLNKGRGFFTRYGQRAGRYAPLLGKILEDHELPRDLIFLAMAESGFLNNAKSWAKAVGPWQFMPYTGKKYGLKIDWYIDERRDPIKATIAAGRYLKKLFKDFNSWELAMAAYNAGEGKMSRAIKRYKTKNYWQIRKNRYLKRETKDYVPKIMALAIIGKNLKSFGFDEIDFNVPLDFDEITINSNTDLIHLSQVISIPFETIQKLNPEILRWFSHPNITKYKLRVPVGFGPVWSNIINSRNLTASHFKEYKVKGRKSELRDVAKKFKIKSYVLGDLNNTPISKRLKRGDIIKLPFRKGQSVRAHMYADLYERPRKSILRRNKYRKIVKNAKRYGTKIINPSIFYTVRKGDSLWNVANKAGISINTLIRSNLSVIKNRMIRAGDRLAIK